VIVDVPDVRSPALEALERSETVDASMGPNVVARVDTGHDPHVEVAERRDVRRIEFVEQLAAQRLTASRPSASRWSSTRT
jgi:hypothetical protein